MKQSLDVPRRMFFASARHSRQAGGSKRLSATVAVLPAIGPSIPCVFRDSDLTTDFRARRDPLKYPPFRAADAGVSSTWGSRWTQYSHHSRCRTSSMWCVGPPRFFRLMRMSAKHYLQVTDDHFEKASRARCATSMAPQRVANETSDAMEHAQNSMFSHDVANPVGDDGLEPPTSTV
jgi:hypothetical protein